MPYRRTIFGIGETYHIFNRSVARHPIFQSSRDNTRALEIMEFYTYLQPPLRFSHFKRLPQKQKEQLNQSMVQKGKLVTLLGFCLMPNHFHFLLQERTEHGVKRFLTNFQNSYAKYINTKTKRSGALFQAMFKAVHIETEEQFLHVLRYIHLNPFTGYVIGKKCNLDEYPWSSYLDYVGKRPKKLVETQQALSSFSSIESFKKFTSDQLKYQRELDAIKHLLIEEIEENP